MKPFVLVVLISVIAVAVGGHGPVPDLEFQGPPGSGEAHLAAGRGGEAILTWLAPVAGRRHVLRVAVRRGGVWSAPQTILESDSFFVNWADFPSLVALPSHQLSG